MACELTTSNKKRGKPDRSLHQCLSVTRRAFRLSLHDLQSAHQRGYQTQRALRRRYTVSPIRRFRGFGHSEKRLSARCLRLVPVALHVMFCRFRGVMRRMMQVALRGVRVVCRCFVIALFVMGRRFAVVTRRVFVMFRCLVVMFCCLLRHRSSSFRC